jgi:hypothetical protein
MSSPIAGRIEEMEWSKFHRLVDDTVTRLRNAEGDREKVESAIRRYLNQGYKYVMSPYILWDYFAISSPGIPARAGYCGYEAEQMEAIFDRLSKEKFGSE